MTSSCQKNDVKVARKYIRDVVNGKQTVCKWVRLFCQRHVRDMETGGKRGLVFSEQHAARVLKFFDFLHHSKGEFGGQPFILSPWQQAYLYVLFGWLKKDTLTRRFRVAYLEVARKAGKSTLSSGVALYLLLGDKEPGAEIYTAATKREQAKIVYDESVRMVRASRALLRHLTVRAGNMFCTKTNSKFEPLSSDYNSLDGLNVHGAIIDELHAHKTRDVWDILETATGARRQPLLFAITTAGVSRQSICRELHDYLEKVLDGVIEDDSFFGAIFTLDEGDDYTDEKTWIKANPNLDISMKRADLRAKLRKAQEAPAALNAFLRLHMNVWTQAEKRWMPPEAWAACSGRTPIEQLKKLPYFMGLDLSSTTDITALVMKFPETGDVLPFFWIPADEMEKRERRDRVPFSSWVRQGFMEATPGNVIDYEYIKSRIRELVAEFPGLQRIGYDPWNATQTAIQLEEEGYPVIPVRQGYQTLSPAAKELEREILGKDIKHGGNPVLAWMASNVVMATDPAENIKPDKARSSERIDGIVALCIALSLQITEEVQESVYEKRGLLLL